MEIGKEDKPIRVEEPSPFKRETVPTPAPAPVKTPAPVKVPA